MKDKLALAGISLQLFSISFMMTDVILTQIFSLFGLILVLLSIRKDHR